VIRRLEGHEEPLTQLLGELRTLLPGHTAPKKGIGFQLWPYTRCRETPVNVYGIGIFRTSLTCSVWLLA
jgi:hypothetical protein